MNIKTGVAIKSSQKKKQQNLIPCHLQQVSLMFSPHPPFPLHPTEHKGPYHNNRNALTRTKSRESVMTCPYIITHSWLDLLKNLSYFQTCLTSVNTHTWKKKRDKKKSELFGVFFGALSQLPKAFSLYRKRYAWMWHRELSDNLMPAPSLVTEPGMHADRSTQAWLFLFQLESLTLSHSLLRKLPPVFGFPLWLKEEGQFQSMHS